MSKTLNVVALGIVLLGLIHDSACRNVLRLPLTTKRPLRPKRGVEDEPLWLFKDDNIPRAPSSGDHPFLPNIIDDMHLDQNRRTARSVDSRDARRGGGSHSTSSGGKDTGPTHPGSNRRNAREAGDEPHWLFKDDNIPRAPSSGDHPFLPNIIDDMHLDQNRRTARSVDSRDARRGGGGHSTSSGGKDTGPTHPGSNRRNAREAGDESFWLEELETNEHRSHERVSRDVSIPGIRKPSYREVIIPNWNPNVRTNPWDLIGGKKH